MDKNAIKFVGEGINFIGRTFDNNGIQGKISRQDFLPNQPFTITATVIGNYKYVKFQKEEYYCSQNINKLCPKPIFKKWDEKIAYFIIPSIQKFVALYNGQQGGYKLEDINEHEILLPVQGGDIDFDFMESFIYELESEQINKLQAYIHTVGLDNDKLTKSEEDSLTELKANSITWSKYKLEDLFDKITTKTLPYKAKELPSEANGDFVLPCLTSSFRNQGLNYYVPKTNATVLKDVITIPSNSDVYRAYFQSNEFTVLSDAYAIRWKSETHELTHNQYLFMTMCINKVTDLPIYSYKNKLGGWEVVKHKYIQLPQKGNDIDFEFMENLISAIKKLTIKSVVEYVDHKSGTIK